MHESQLQLAAFAAVELRRTRPDASALEILDLALHRPVSAVSAPLDPAITHPASPFGQVIAAAFDADMTPEEWLAWAGEGSEQSICEALLRFWSDEVLPKFSSRYGLAAAA